MIYIIDYLRGAFDLPLFYLLEVLPIYYFFAFSVYVSYFLMSKTASNRVNVKGNNNTIIQNGNDRNNKTS